jgi:hypothetical protein
VSSLLYVADLVGYCVANASDPIDLVGRRIRSNEDGRLIVASLACESSILSLVEACMRLCTRMRAVVWYLGALSFPGGLSLL